MKRLFVGLVSAFAAVFVLAGSEPEVGEEEYEKIAERLAPFGKSCMKGEDCGVAAPAIAPSGSRTGKEVYDQHCFACHATGVQDAPLVGSDAWDERIAKGKQTLLENTRNGFSDGLMPPMGTCVTCTDEEFWASITYMVTGDETALPLELEDE